MMSTKRNHFLKLILAILAGVSCVRGEAKLQEFDSPYYEIWTDLPVDAAREAALRMTKMADEYRNRTRDFSGTIHGKMPFYLYAHDEDYLEFVPLKDSAGYFDGKNLVAKASHLDDRTWHTVQHEGFHQFARGTIRGTLPTWANEGLAEYFGEAVFTGDGFVAGVIPQWRLQRMRQTIKSNGFMSIDRIMNLSHEEWNQKLTTANYDEGWSMVQFLAHGENGKYQRAFVNFVGELNNTKDPQSAWADCFGSGDGFEQQWKAYWTGLPDAPSLDLYAQAEVQTYTSFLARATAMKQTFATFADFQTAAKQKKLQMNPNDWLPDSLLQAAMERQKDFDKLGCTFAIETVKGDRNPHVTCKLPGGQIITSKFIIRGDHVASVTATTSKK